MIDFKNANQAQKSIVTGLLKGMLQLIHCQENYRLEEKGGHLIIRESASHPPSERQQAMLRHTLSQLSPFIAVHPSQMRAIIGEGIFAKVRIVPFFDIHEINEATVNATIASLNPAGVVKPAEIDDLAWARLPGEVKERWGRFSPEMQKYLVECTAVNLPNLFHQVSEARLDDLGLTFLSPISFGPPPFPVRLPTPTSVDDVRADVNKVYDLLEVLAIAGRDPHDRSRRSHPVTREYFSLNEVLPAPDALMALKERAEKVLDGGAPAAAASSSHSPRKS